VEHVLLRNSILRFIIFDGIGLVLLAVAWKIVNKMTLPAIYKIV
jgi:hypothetical protein